MRKDRFVFRAAIWPFQPLDIDLLYASSRNLFCLEKGQCSKWSDHVLRPPPPPPTELLGAMQV